MAKKPMIAQPITVEWDKPRKWCFNMAAMMQLAAKYENLGEVFATLSVMSESTSNITEDTLNIFVDVLFAGFSGYNKDLSREDVLNGLGPQNFAYFANVIGEAMKEQSPDPVEGADPK